MASSDRAARGASRGPAALTLVLVGVFVTALTLRVPIVSPSPVMADIASEFGVDAGAAGLITTAPVLMFALMTPVAALLIRRRGPEVAVLVTLVGVILGSAVRAAPGFGSMLAGMIVIGASITIGNVVMPVIIRREVTPARVATATAAYAATMNLGSLVASIGTAPLAELIGWRWAVFAWVAIAVVGVCVWSAHMTVRGREGRRADDARARSTISSGARDAVSAMTGPSPIVSADSGTRVLARPVTLLLLVAFGMQSGSYYALTTWLPTIAADELGVGATTAGALASVFQGVAIAGAFLAPFLLRWRGPLTTAATVSVAWLTVTLGMALAPQLIVLWLVVGAIAQAGGFVTIFSFMVAAARSDGEAASMSAAVQGGGYVISTLGAPLTGVIHDATGGWTIPLLALFGATVIFTLALMTVARLAR